MATKTESKVYEIKAPQFDTIKVKIVGDTPLIVHAWDAKAKREILEKEVFGKAVKKREAKDPIRDFAASMYWLTPMPDELDAENIGKAFEDGARFGFPTTAIKQCAINAAYRLGWAKDKASLRPAFQIIADAHGYYGGELVINHEKESIDIIPNMFKPYDMCEIISDPPVMREDMVKVMNGAADIRYRGEFQNWSIILTVQYNKNGQYSAKDILNIIQAGGYACGIGEWRTERDGVNGQFHIEAD